MLVSDLRTYADPALRDRERYFDEQLIRRLGHETGRGVVMTDYGPVLGPPKQKADCPKPRPVSDRHRVGT